MFRGLVKLAIVKALQRAYDSNYDGIKPLWAGIAWPEKEEEWPGIIVEFRPDVVRWTGINPDEYRENDDDFTQVRAGHFEGNVDLTILASSTAELDRLWDGLTELIMFGDITAQGSRFHDTINENEYIALTIRTSEVTPAGEQVGRLPWNPDKQSFEASLRLPVVGQFYTDAYTATLLPLSDIQVYPYRGPDEPVPGEDDGDGVWV